MDIVFIKSERQKPTRKAVHALLTSMPEHEQLHDALAKCMIRCSEEFDFSASGTMMMCEIMKRTVKGSDTVQKKKVTFERSVV